MGIITNSHGRAAIWEQSPRLLTCLLTCLAILLPNVWPADAPASRSLSAAAYDLSVYDDALAPGWENWSSDSRVDLSSHERVHSGTASIATNFLMRSMMLPSAALELHSGTTMPGNTYETLRFWIHGGCAGGQEMTVALVDEEYERWGIDMIVAPANRWQLIELPISGPGTPDSITGIVWASLSPFDQPTFYVDDVAFTNQAPSEIPTATPAASATATFTPMPLGVSTSALRSIPEATSGNQVRIYGDALAPGWSSLSSAGADVKLANVSPVAAGSASIAITLSLGMGWFSLKPPNWSVIGQHETLRFWINGGQAGGRQVYVSITDVMGHSNEIYVVTLVPEVWQQVDAPIYAITGAIAINWSDQSGCSQPVFYLDEISLIGPPTPEPTATPASRAYLPVLIKGS